MNKAPRNTIKAAKAIKMARKMAVNSLYGSLHVGQAEQRVRQFTNIREWNSQRVLRNVYVPTRKRTYMLVEYSVLEEMCEGICRDDPSVLIHECGHPSDYETSSGYYLSFLDHALATEAYLRHGNEKTTLFERGTKPDNVGMVI